MMECESGYFSLVYQGRYYNFREANNLVDRIRSGVYKGEPHDTYVFVFTDNCVLNSVFYKGTSKIPLLFKTVL